MIGWAEIILSPPTVDLNAARLPDIFLDCKNSYKDHNKYILTTTYTYIVSANKFQMYFGAVKISFLTQGVTIWSVPD